MSSLHLFLYIRCTLLQEPTRNQPREERGLPRTTTEALHHTRGGLYAGCKHRQIASHSEQAHAYNLTVINSPSSRLLFVVYFLPRRLFALASEACVDDGACKCSKCRQEREIPSAPSIQIW